MVRIEAGAEFPDHDHNQDEEIFVLEGDLIMGELTLKAGDYHLAQASRHHPVSRSRTGCLCIITQGYAA
jgi:anti-sigma factor ChrR (cupin superfamily)